MMQQKERMKMCWNCEAEVSYEATYCPFCGTDLLSMNPAPSELKSEPNSVVSDEEPLSNLYKPPYTSRNRHGLGIPDERDLSATQVFTHQSYSTPKEPEVVSSAKNQDTGSIWSLLLLSIAGNLLTLGLLLFFFSDEGKLTLEWNGHYWFIYCILAIPCLVIGFKSLRPKRPLTDSEV